MERQSSEFQTPDPVCSLMAGMVPTKSRRILEPTAGEGRLVRALGKYDVYAPADFSQVPNSSRWDCIVMNPPFSPMKIGYEILYKCMRMSDSIIALMPWLSLINSEKRTRDINEFGLRAVYHLPRSTFPGARVQCCILQMERGFVGQTGLEFVNLTSGEA